MSQFSATIDGIIEQARSGELKKQAEQAPAPGRVVVGEEAQAIVKVASMLREVSSEPTYADVLAFIERC